MAGTLIFTNFENTGRPELELPVTSDRNFTLALDGVEAGTTIEYQQVIFDDENNITRVIALAGADFSTGHWSTPIYLRAKVTDAVGNSSYTDPQGVLIDITGSRIVSTLASAHQFRNQPGAEVVKPELLVLSDGSYYVAWGQVISSRNYQFYQYYDNSGQAVGEQISIPLLSTSQSSASGSELFEITADQIGFIYSDSNWLSVRHGSVVPGGSELLTNYTGGGGNSEHDPTAVALGGGNYALLTSYLGSSYVSHSVRLGFYNSEAQLQAYHQHSGINPAMVAMPDGLALVWETSSYRADVSSVKLAIHVDNQTVTSELLVGAAQGNAAPQILYLPQVDAAGQLVVAWNSNGAVALQRYSVEGDPIGDTIVHDSGGADNQIELVAVGNNGAFAVISDNPASNTIQFYSASGEEVGSPTQLSTGDTRYSGGASDFAAISLGDSGQVVVAWLEQLSTDFGYGIPNRVFVQRFTASGEPLGERIDAPVGYKFHITGLSLAALPGGEWLLSYTNSRDYNSHVFGELLHFDRHGELIPRGLVTLSSDSGRFANDLITDTAEQLVTMELSADLAYSELLLGRLDAEAEWLELTDYLQGRVLSWPVTLAASGNLQLMIEDGAGNQTVIVDQQFRVDAQAPTTQLTAISLSADSGADDSDFITSHAEQRITATLTAPLAEDELLYGSVDEGLSWQLISDRVSGTELDWATGATLHGDSALVFKIVDVAGNQGPLTRVEYTLLATDIDTSVVLFDLVNGASSSHSGRHFSSAVDYTIYLLVDSDTTQLTSAGSGWGSWSGGANLTASDKLVIVGDSGAIDIVGLHSAAGLADGDDLSAATDQLRLQVGNDSMVEQLIITAGGALTRRMAYSDSGIEAQLWSGTAQLAGTLRSGQFLSSLPAGLLTSQGLS